MPLKIVPPRIVLRFTLLAVVITLTVLSAAPIHAQQGPDSVTVAKWLGINRPPNGISPTEYSKQLAAIVKERVQSQQPNKPNKPNSPSSGGLPTNFEMRAPLSPAVLTTLGGSSTLFQEGLLMADIDGREDLVADHSAKIADFTNVFTGTGQMLTRAAISEHTIANGFTETITYLGDSVGNVYVVANTSNNGPSNLFTINLPTELNAFGTLNSDDQIVVTGIAINPVSDLSAYANVNGSFAPYNGLIGEQVYISFWDTGGGLRLASNNQLVRSGLLAFPVADITSAAAAPPAIQSPAGFPVQVGGNFGVAFSVFSNLAGVAVDDDSSVYFQQVDLIQFSGANIVKLTSQDIPGNPALGVAGNQDRSSATNGIITLTTLNPLNGDYGTASGPSKQVNRFTNYSGTATTFGNIAALATGPGNALYAATARSFVASDDAATQATEGLFANPVALGPTPSMIVSFSDVTGKFDVCSAPPGVITFTNPVTVVIPYTGSVPIADGIADVAQAGLTLTPGVNNFRVFVEGTGPDIRSAASAIGATPANTLQMAFQVDYTIFGGITVDEENTVYAISGGTPAGVGRNPSPNLGEILTFPDRAFSDRRADYVDLRTTGQLPNPPSSGSFPNVGDGASDRYDHIYYLAPIDPRSVAPTGLAGLTRGFLMYLNRTRTNNTNFASLPNGAPQAAASSSGPFNFNSFDASPFSAIGHVAGGDFNVSPFTADGVFDFNCAGGGAGCGTPISSTVFLNANGNLSFGGANAVVTPTVASFLGAAHPIVAPAFASLNPNSHTVYSNTFPVQALGFASANDFKTRWINVPEVGMEACGSSNTFSVSLFDDGLDTTLAFGSHTGRTDLRFTGAGATLAGGRLRSKPSGWFYFDYGRTDMLGLPTNPVIAGYAVGGLPTNLSATNLSTTARAIDALNNYNPALLIPFSPATNYEFFNTAVPAAPNGQLVTPAKPVFDLRFEGNDPVLGTPVNQPEANRGVLGLENALPALFIPLVDR